MIFPSPIQNLINFLTKLPSVGPKTAERYVFYLLKQDPEELQKFAQAIAELKEKTKICSECLAIAESDLCPICADKKRDKSIICVTANTRDMAKIEATGQFNGIYHILGGVLDQINGKGPESLNIKQLIEKIKKNKTKQIILAFSPNFNGEATTLYLSKLLKPYKIKIYRLAKGLPTGAELEYADEITLSNSLKYKNEI